MGEYAFMGRQEETMGFYDPCFNICHVCDVNFATKRVVICSLIFIYYSLIFICYYFIFIIEMIMKIFYIL